jgi:hypothetical protein
MGKATHPPVVKLVAVVVVVVMMMSEIARVPLIIDLSRGSSPHLTEGRRKQGSTALRMVAAAMEGIHERGRLLMVVAKTPEMMVRVHQAHLVLVRRPAWD